MRLGKIQGLVRKCLPLRFWNEDSGVLIPNPEDTNNRGTVAGQRLLSRSLEEALLYIVRTLTTGRQLRILKCRGYFPYGAKVFDNLRVNASAPVVTDGSRDLNGDERSPLPEGATCILETVRVGRLSPARGRVEVVSHIVFEFIEFLDATNIDAASIETWAGVTPPPGEHAHWIPGEFVSAPGNGTVPDPQQISVLMRSFLDLIRDVGLQQDTLEFGTSRRPLLWRLVSRARRHFRRFVHWIINATEGERWRRITEVTNRRQGPPVGAYEFEFRVGLIPAGKILMQIKEEPDTESTKTRTYRVELFVQPLVPGAQLVHVATAKGRVSKNVRKKK